MKRILKWALLGLSIAGGLSLVTIAIIYFLQPREIRVLDGLLRKQDYAEILLIFTGRSTKNSDLNTSTHQDARARWLRRRSDAGHVPLQLVMARALASREPQEAFRWLAVAQTGAMLDGALCADPAARPAPAFLSDTHRELVKTMEENPQTRIEALEAAISWHREHSSRPNPKWICGFGSTGKKNDSLLPQSQWSAARQVVFQQFEATLQTLKNRPQRH